VIIQSKLTCRLRIYDQEEIVFTENEPVVIPARWAVPLLMKFPDAVELVSTVLPGHGQYVTWMENEGRSKSGMVVLNFSYRQGQEQWVLVLTEGHGQFVKVSDIIGVNVAPLCRLAWEAAQRLGTPESEGMAADVVTTLCGIDPNDITQ